MKISTKKEYEISYAELEKILRNHLKICDEAIRLRMDLNNTATLVTDTAISVVFRISEEDETVE